MCGRVLRTTNHTMEAPTPAPMPCSIPRAKVAPNVMPRRREVTALDPPQVAHFADVDQADDRGQDDRRQHRFGQEVEQRGEPQQGRGDHGGGDQAGHGRARPGLGVDRGAGKAAGDGVGAEHGAAEVGRAEADEFAVGVDLVATAPGEGLGHGDRLHKADEGDGDGDGQELSHGVAVPATATPDRGSRREHGRRWRRRGRPGPGPTPSRVPPSTTASARGKRGGKPAQGEEGDRAGEAENHRGTVDLAQLINGVGGDAVDVMAAGDLDAEECV